jgi:ABC-type taurine transport system substrate-binding protein
VLFDPSTDFTKGPGPTDEFINPDVLIATRETIKNKPDSVAAFAKAYHDKGIAYLIDPATKAKAIEEIQTYMRSVGAGLADLESTAESVEAIEFYTLQESKDLLGSEKFVQAATRQAQFWLDAGAIKKMPDIAAAINADLISG